MKRAQLSGSLRENVGKKGAAAERKAGNVPAVLYGAGEPHHFAVNAMALGKLVFTPDVFLVELDLNGTKKEAIIKDVQFHPVTDEVLHADFLELQDGKEVKLKMPVRITGNSIGVRNGGKRMVLFRKVDVKGLPNALPEEVVVDVTPLKIGQSIRIKDLKSDGVEFLNEPNAVVVQIRAARGAAAGSEDEDEEGEGEEAAEEATAEA